ncbi:alpha/beta fold hydrolase [Variovorax sp. PAMC 28711]|uniref:alpha/beta fold hydrolase n=1 Tax=Variovorax sp. PAMC 28711 TaxID=1795631 RepID=UPI00078CEC5D|nr:alpha/beta hydrolase [Variovorax sp. PAMC 28711]AMM25480.1 alpha/beta hydrolase [Variovorax sp. PAMC 28711]
MKLTANGLQIEVEDTGGEGRPVVLLIMGLGMQLIAWPEPFVKGLVDAGFRVVRHDNRDIGLSQGFDHAGIGNLVWQTVRQRLGLPVQSAYALQDMANDSIGVLDALGIAEAHIVGASMGGMIAQRVAATAPKRAASLVSIMSSSGARGLPGPRRDVGAALLRRPTGKNEAALVAHSLGFIKLIASPAYPQPDSAIAERVTFAMRRAYHPSGMLRQMLAIGADAGREKVLPSITAPTLVLHGEADALVPIECGQDTARRIPGATFVPVPGMGHDLPPEVGQILLGHMIPFMREAPPSANAKASA